MDALDYTPTSPSQLSEFDADAVLEHERRMSAVRERLQQAHSAAQRTKHAVQEIDEWSVNPPTNYRQSASGSTMSIDNLVSNNESVEYASHELKTAPSLASTSAPKARSSTSRSRSSGGAKSGTARQTSRAKSRARKLPVHIDSDSTRVESADNDVNNTGAEPDTQPGDAASADTSLLGIVRRASRTQQRINYSKRVLGDKISLHCMSHQSITALQRDARPLAALVRSVGQTLRDVAHCGSTAQTQLESTLCDTLHETLEQWHSTVLECSAHMQRMQRYLEVMYNHLHQLTDSVNSIQASFLQRQCHAADAAGHRSILHGMIERRAALEIERNGGDVRPTQLWGSSVQVQQLPMFVASREICSSHASNSFKGINVEFTPRRRNASGSRSGSRARSGSGGGRRSKKGNAPENTPTPAAPPTGI